MAVSALRWAKWISVGVAETAWAVVAVAHYDMRCFDSDSLWSVAHMARSMMTGTSEKPCRN